MNRPLEFAARLEYIKELETKAAGYKAERDRLQGKWDEEGDRCAQCGLGNPKLTEARAALRGLDEPIAKLMKVVLAEGPSRDALVAVGELHQAHADNRRALGESTDAK